jgi:excisionase family DNA binding protein
MGKGGEIVRIRLEWFSRSLCWMTIMPKELDVTTQEAAMFLNVSRPYLIRLLEDGKIAFHKVETHRRIRFADLRHYKEDRQKISHDALQELADQAQKLNLGY